MAKKQTPQKAGSKRKIDRLRKGAGSLEIGSLDDNSAITGMLVVGGTMHVIKEKGVYEVKLADEIDPERTNIAIPNTVQRILKFGSNDEWVGKTLLTGQAPFNSSYLPNEINCDAAMELMLAIVRNIGAMQEYAREFNEQEKAALESIDDKVRQDGSFVLPSIEGVEHTCKSFIQRADHALRDLFGLVKLFYGDDVGNKWFEGFAERIKNSDDGNDNFGEFLGHVLPMLLLIRNARNCVEHPTENQRLLTTDFVINAERELVTPTIEIIHPKTPQQAVGVAEFVQVITDQLVGVIELMVAFLCGRHVQSTAGFPFQVFLLPEEKRSNKYVRYGYGLYDGKNVIPAS